MTDLHKTLEDLERRAELGGGEERQKKQHDAGKLTARERIDLLFDPGTFEEVDKLVTHRCRDFGMERQLVPGDGVVAGHGLIDGRQVFAFAQDFTVFGGMTHNATSGVAHFAVDDDRECLALIRDLLALLPSNNLDDPPRLPVTDPADREDAALDTMVPASPNQPYDMLDVIHAIVDEGHFLEVHRHYAKNILVGFARLDGRPVGIVANQPAELAVMGPEGAVNILYKRELEAAADPAAARAEKVAEFREKFANPYIAAARGFIDEVIHPRSTRPKLVAALKNLDNKRDKNPPKKHGNIPL